ncbi:MAG: phage tail spike protein [Moorellales bacterium]
MPQANAPEYIQVLSSTGSPVAFLSPKADGIKNCWVDAKLNGESCLTFEIPRTSPKCQYLTPLTRIVAMGREFVIPPNAEPMEEERDGQKLWMRVRADESWVLLGKKYKTISNDPNIPNPPDLAVIIVSGGSNLGGSYPVGSAGHALYALLAGTGWSLGTVDVAGTFDLETEKETVLANINRVQELWGGYLVWDSITKTLSLLDENAWQEYRGYQVRYRKNLKGITRTIDTDLITRLWPFGENDLDIASVNNGVKYLEDFSYTTEVLEGIWRDQGIADPNQLKAKAQQVLAKAARPRYNYRIEGVHLSVLPEWAHEELKLGDMIDVIDEELGIGARLRVIRIRQNVFQPWKMELEVGDPMVELKDLLAESARAADFAKKVLLYNPGIGNLWKGFVNTFATVINSANGKLVWNDATLEAIEVDAQGAPTGKRVRITPGGIGVSTDGGQTYEIAITGLGVLANKVIVNELYALATADGLTKLAADGLHVYDRSQIERLIAGRWTEGQTEHFGLQVKAQDGQTVLLDDRGLLQTWQEGRADNVDSTHPLVLNVYIPPETRQIKRALLRFRLQAFRAYETGAASGGGTTVTSASGGGTSTTTESGGGTYPSTDDDIWHLYGNEVPDVMTWEGDHWHYTDTAGYHNHGIASGTQLALYGGGYITWTPSGNHYHSTDVDGGHAHNLDARHYHNVSIPSHTHNISIPNHTHDVTVPNHTHSINFGIYTGQSSTNVTCKINGVDRTSVLGGPWNSDQANLNIASYLVAGQWNTIELGSEQLGRIDATVFVQILLGV